MIPPDHAPATSPSSCAPAVDANIACDECGAFGAFVFDGVKLCSQCYSEQGSCCHEFSSGPHADSPTADSSVQPKPGN